MTVNQLKPHICIGFSHLPVNSYLHLNEAYEVDEITRNEVRLHLVNTGESIRQSLCHLRSSHMYLA